MRTELENESQFYVLKYNIHRKVRMLSAMTYHKVSIPVPPRCALAAPQKGPSLPLYSLLPQLLTLHSRSLLFVLKSYITESSVHIPLYFGFFHSTLHIKFFYIYIFKMSQSTPVKLTPVRKLPFTNSFL